MENSRGRSQSAKSMTSGISSGQMSHSLTPSTNSAFNDQANARGLDPSLPHADIHGIAASSAQEWAQEPSIQYTPQQINHLSDQDFLQAQDFTQQLPLQNVQSSDFYTGSSQNDLDPALLNNSYHHQAQDYQSVNLQSYLDSNGLDHMNQQSSDQALTNNSNRYSLGAGFQATHHSRNQSLDPSSALYPQGHTHDYATAAFHSHRRTPSDNFSDVSSNSAQPSPFMQNADNFEPMDNQHLPLFNDNLGFEDFSLSDPNTQQQSYISPAHSPYISPDHSPGQHNMPFPTIDPYPMNYLDAQFGGDAGPDIYSSFPLMAQNSSHSNDHSQGAMSPPEISIDLAPGGQPGPTINEPGQGDVNGDALSPPSRTATRLRGRAISDPYTPGQARDHSPNRARAPSLGVPGSRPASRSSSPSGPPNGIQKPRDRASSTSSVPHSRNWMLGLADEAKHQPNDSTSIPNVTGSSDISSNGSKRHQKHPATFQCTLCPKRFTRAYNLRSHLRTHTDERPFICTVCNKAFARQHDRKRHEGLHSGEKKFVCKGLLGGGPHVTETWGCGRRFARADALGRHFRSEAGRACIKPLLDEEARERQTAMRDQANQELFNASADPSQAHLHPIPVTSAAPLDFSGMTLPAALLAQYPALAGIEWDALPPMGEGTADEGEYDANGRSDFDASSGGEFEFDIDDEGGARAARGDNTGFVDAALYNDANMGNWQMGMGLGVDIGAGEHLAGPTNTMSQQAQHQQQRWR